MAEPRQPLPVTPPSLPKGGGAIQSIGKGQGAVGATGTVSQDIPLPIIAGRFAPLLWLSYSSGAGQSEFGQGWAVSLPAIARRASAGVPTYSDQDEFAAPNNEVLVVECDSQGDVVRRTVASFRGAPLDQPYEVVRYFTRVEGAGDRIESWRGKDGSWFWVVHSADGSVHVYGKTALAQTAHGEGADRRIARWWLEESVNAHGQKIRYEYVKENAVGLPEPARARDHNTHVYPWRVLYGNKTGSQLPYCLTGGSDEFHFELLFDYGERTTALTQTPPYAYAPSPRTWPVRPDPFSSFAHGFEERTLRVCRQILMFRREATAPYAPWLVGRLLIEYEQSPYVTQLAAVHQVGYDPQGKPAFLPPLEFAYTPFDAPETARFQAFQALAGMKGGGRYQLVDLYGEGLTGVLHQTEKGWYYQEPLRAGSGGNEVVYGDWALLPRIPAVQERSTVRQSLNDMTGDGKLDWVVAGAGVAGFFTMSPDRTWSGFVPFAAFPTEFAHEHGQLVDLVGAGLGDFAMIGTRSVRFYPSARESGFGLPVDVLHAGEALPGQGDGRGTLVAFADILGSGQQHLVRIRHDGIDVWPNLGRGKFGQRLRFASLPFSQASFEASRVRLADLDGSGAVDLIYLQHDGALIFRNRSGHGLADSVLLPWPEDVHYDDLCEVEAADLEGLGCASLVLTVPHMQPRHWRCDFAKGIKPFLLCRSDNNMGADSEVVYRSSAQEWLDEKRELTRAGKPPVCLLPLSVPVVVEQRQNDQIVQQTQTQRFSYRQGFYDGRDRQFRGFGLVLKSDSEAPAAGGREDGFTAPVLVKTWYHLGRQTAVQDQYDASDPALVPLGPTLYARYRAGGAGAEPADLITEDWDADIRHQLARALSGAVLRIETFALDGGSGTPYAITDNRYLVRLLRDRHRHQPHVVVQSFLVEAREAHYERMRSDPRIVHTINLRWDIFGSPEHGAVVHYARRQGGMPEELVGEHAQRWWRDSHDEVQHGFYVAETRAQWIHLTEPDRWRIGLPYRTRSNAWQVARDALPVRDIGYEKFIDRQAGPIADRVARTLTGLSVQRYVGCQEGEGSLEALPDYIEMAELDDRALRAYERVMSRAELARVLAEEARYHRMATFLPHEAGVELWSVQHGFTRYGDVTVFFQPDAYQLTRDLGITRIAFDAYRLFPARITTPDGLETHVWHDYQAMQPIRLRDPNHAEQEVRYDGAGRVIATSFRGQEQGVPIGFDPLSDYVRHLDLPEEALADPQRALGKAATAFFYAPFAWMGRVPLEQVPEMEAALSQRWLMPGGYVRAMARRRLEHGLPDDMPAALADLAAAMRAAVRVPPHALGLQADRYPGDPAQQIRMSLTYSDGFGRVLQQKIRVEPGLAYVVSEDGTLKLDNGRPVQSHANERWRVSERVEYNNKGLPVRTYRPYFADRHRYIRDEAFRQFGHCDRQYYDPLGRPTVTLTAAGWMRRQTYWPWHTVSEDENDTADDLQQQ